MKNYYNSMRTSCISNWKSVFAVVVFMLTTIIGNAQVAVNPGAGSYTTLKGAFDAINLGTHTGAITIDLSADTAETVAAVLNASGSGAASYTSVLIQPTGAGVKNIIGNIAGHLVDLNGADNVTINGVNANATLVVSNTSTGTSSSTIRFSNDASGNTVTNTTVLGSTGAGLSTGFGVIYFATGTTTGNDNNTINNCNIGPAGTNLPINGIYSLGSSTVIDNSSITISNNNIFDFFNSNGITSAINVNSSSSTWSITGNKIYQTASRTYLTGNTHFGINVLTGTGYTISNNTIGGNAPVLGGTYAIAGAVASRYVGINITSGTATSPVNSLQGNTISNFTIATTSGATTTTGVFCGISVTNGNNNIGTVTGNTIGATTGLNNIVATSTTSGALVVGIHSGSTGTMAIQNNSIGALSSSGVAAAIAGSVTGINISVGSASMTISSNTVGNTTVDSMRGGTSGLTTGSSLALGINITTAQLANIIRNNTIQNLTSYGTGLSSVARGIYVTTGAIAHIISGNTVRNLASNSTSVSFASGQCPVIGIYLGSGTNAIITSNTINNLGLTNTGAVGSAALGISIAATTDTTISRNYISDIYNASTSASVTGPGAAAGIFIRSSTTGITIVNNMISLGTGRTENTAFIGIWGQHGSTPDPLVRVYHNSINIAGTASAGAQPSFCFARTDFSTTARTAAVDVRNNIFNNNRTGGTGSHFAIANNYGATPSVIGWGVNAANNNVLNANAATIGHWTSALDFATWKTTSASDTNSIVGNPLFVSASDLNLQATSPAIDIAVNLAVTNDIVGDSRPGLNTLFDIGADERDGIPQAVNDVQATAFINPTNGGSKAQNVAFAPQASFTNNGTANQTNITVRYRIVDPTSVEVYNQTVVIPSLASLASTNIIFPNATLTASGLYTIFARAELVGDTVLANDQINGTLNVLAPLSGTYTVGTAGNYPSLTNANGIFDAINNLGASSNLTINIISDLTGETGAVALNEISGGFTTLIQPTGAARTITGSINGGLIKLNSADNVTINGSTTSGSVAACLVGGNAALRELTIQNTNVGTSVAVISIQSGLNGAQNNTIKNVNVSGQDPTTSLIGISIGGNSPGSTGADNDNNRVENCAVQKSISGIFSAGFDTANKNTGTVISNNDLSSIGANRIRRVGILLFNDSGANVNYNSISVDTNESADGIGIGIGIQDLNATATTSLGVIGALVSNNKINGVISSSTVGYSAAGIAVAGDVGSPNIIQNNMISGVTAPSTSPDIVAGIFVAGVTGSNTKLYYNTISNSGDRGAVAGQIGSFGIAISGTDPNVELKNNIVSNTQTSTGGANAKSYAIGMTSTTFANLDSNYNDFVSSGLNDGGNKTGNLNTGGTEYATLALWQVAVADDANSVEIAPVFVSGTDLHLDTVGNPTLDNLGTVIAVVTQDFDCAARSATTPDMGADEFTTLSIDKFDSVIGFKAYPNPVSSILNIEYTSDLTSVSVYNMVGQQVLAKKVNATSTQIDMANLNAGMYLVTIEAGNVSKTIKVVKK